MRGLACFVAAMALSSMALGSSDEPEWWHGHGHGGGGVTAAGKPGDARKVSRTVTLQMRDGAPFTPATITVKRGETIRFIVKNTGKVKHEMVFGTEGQLTELYHVRMQAPSKERTPPNAVAVEGGKSGEIIWEFTKFGTVSFACLLPGHYDAGERGTVIVQ
ncbi:hypothetical protein D2917_07745 [Cupriavidus oxalaticus]|uniref:Blue (type 1) copper domain-containing protein n=2 Tax=Cupriavidus oxalaticus TaxID=96344 RepID=A0A5P3VFJ2_9BURK|nr:hypothetical protein D2917_07745 [Cupriavidus oxalaticus]